MGIRPQQQPIPTSQTAQEVLEQTEMIHKDARKNTMQAYIKYKAYYDKKANSSKLNEADYVYILQPKVDHQGSKIPFTEFRRVGPYIIEKALPNNKLSGTQNWHKQDASAASDENASVHTPPTTSRHNSQAARKKSYPEVSLNHDDLYARAWEYDFEQPIFDAENDNAAPPNLQEIPVQSDYSTEEMRNTPGSPHVCSPEIFPNTDELGDVTDTCPIMEPDVETSPELPQNSPTNPRSSKYNLRHNPKPNCNDDYRY